MSSLFGKKRKKSLNSERHNTDLKRKQDEIEISSSPIENNNFNDLGLAEPLVETCRALGFKRPTPVQRNIIPYLLQEESAHVLALASTGSGKTAAFVLPILHRLSADPYGIYAVIVSPTRELAKQIHQQVLALGSSYNVESTLVVGGMDMTKQSTTLEHRKPHFVVATPGRLAELLRGPSPPKLQHVRFLVLDEADRLLTANSGFERDVAELLLHCNRNKRTQCQTLLFSATMTRSLESVEKIAGAGQGRLPLKKFVIRDDQYTGLKQEYIFMPSRVRDAYLLTTIRTLLSNGGRARDSNGRHAWRGKNRHNGNESEDNDDDEEEEGKSRSAIVFVATCERAALVSEIFSHVGVENVALHSLLTQNRRLAALAKFKSQQVRVLVATDIASRGLDVPSVDLVINSELPRNPVSYIHRIGRTARAGRRGRAISLVSETDVSLVHAAEEITGRPLGKCSEVTDEAAIKMLGPVTKAARLAKMKLMDIGFDDLVKKFKERKVRDRKDPSAQQTARCLRS
ncbi:DEAD-domain-containing protein [Fragilariopsis cylindrus CCMP1102]|uniref:DEAD-domain-containing protein n=1 Tax=Fragilariopsis cylindrus CCMP1102 TaxID=635003 RepID=A0A1E7FB22_9STRA|nr:DEAD-domain-containing protein [Fragilariopsis cylindrus CCMP1102]|eukprot:OEU15344.1 DEAD-domain-containing protein [Fragilariopsis cylindrus CCMP1102]